MTSTGFRPENWVFLGDSLTEGVGSGRTSYVSELVKLLRDTRARPTLEFRLRPVHGLSRFVQFNVAGFLSPEDGPGDRLWIWNFASEGSTIANDVEWLPLIDNLRPSRVFLLRGALESIIRPAALQDESWPKWVPNAWRGYAAMDPRCYFSTTPWRRAKQVSVDALKQRTRLRLLRSRPGVRLMPQAVFAECFRHVVNRLGSSAQITCVLGLPPVSESTFPGSSGAFRKTNDWLRETASRQALEFLDWGEKLEAEAASHRIFYRDGFHPNEAGARFMGRLLYEHLESQNHINAEVRASR